MAITSERRSRCIAAALAAACAFTAVNLTSGAALAGTPDMPPNAARLTVWQRAVLLHATRQFRDVRRAIEAGYLPTRQCVPGMGFHYAKPSLAGDPNIDPTLPEFLVYTTGSDGTLRLAALEFFRADADQNPGTDADRPTLFGYPFDGPMAGHPLPPGEPSMPIHYDLHVWLYQDNPSGELATTNPNVDCK
jgi:hypothetical protein